MASNVSAVSGSVANGQQTLASRFHKPPVSSRTVGFPESGWRPWHFLKHYPSSSLLRAHAPDPFPPVVSLRIRIGQLIRLDSHQLDYSLVGCSDAPVLMCCIRKEIVPRINHIPRRARIDAPGALHHVICRGIERRKIFFEDMISVMPYRGSHK
jgi:hypothetical protein